MEPKINTQVQSFLTILMVCIITPMIAGGAISLAASYSGEAPMVESPNQVNGFGWAGGSQGDCNTTTLTGVPTTPSPSSVVMSYAGENYTSLTAPYLDGNQGGSSGCYTTSANPFRLNLPAGTFATNESHSRFVYSWTATSGCTSSCSTQYYDAGWEFTWALVIDNTTVMEYDSTQKGYMEYGSNIRSHWHINHSMAPIDYNRVHRALAECDTTCTYQLQFKDITKGTSATGDFSSAPWETGGGHKITTYALSEIEASLVLAVAPWLLGLIFMAVALASTPWWNPVMGNVSSRMKGGLI